MGPRFHLLVSDVYPGNEEEGGLHDFLAWSQRWKDFT